MAIYTVSRSQKFKSNVPSLNEWERLSGGSKAIDRDHVLLKYIDKKVYEHFIYYRDFVTLFDARFLGSPAFHSSLS